MKKFKKLAFLFLILVIIILAFTIYTSAKQNDSNEIQEKTLSEVDFIESKLVDLFNSMNNIEYENYKISSESVSDETKNLTSTESETSSSSSSSGGQQGKEGSESQASSSNETSEEGTNSRTK